MEQQKINYIDLMNGRELRERRNKLGIIRRYFSNLLEVEMKTYISSEKLARWENSQTKIPAAVEQAVANIEERLNKSKTRSLDSPLTPKAEINLIL